MGVFVAHPDLVQRWDCSCREKVGIQEVYLVWPGAAGLTRAMRSLTKKFEAERLVLQSSGLLGVGVLSTYTCQQQEASI